MALLEIFNFNLGASFDSQFQIFFGEEVSLALG